MDEEQRVRDFPQPSQQGEGVGTGCGHGLPPRQEIDRDAGDECHGEMRTTLHDGCAGELTDRFDPACGGDSHGNIDALDANELGDLVEYLRSR